MCIGGSSSQAPAPVSSQKVFVPIPEYQKVQIAPPPATTEEMLANRNKQAFAKRARKPLKRANVGPSSLRIRPSYT